MSSKLDENGHEKLDTTPVEMPLGFQHPEPLEERIRRLIRSSVSDHAHDQGAETFEEADDFDIPDDDSDPITPFEMDFDPSLGKEVSPQMILENQEHYAKVTEERYGDSEPVPSEPGERVKTMPETKPVDEADDNKAQSTPT